MPDHILPCLPVGVGAWGCFGLGNQCVLLVSHYRPQGSGDVISLYPLPDPQKISRRGGVPKNHCPTPRFSMYGFSLSTTRPKVRKKACLTTYYPAYPWVGGRGFIWCGGNFLALPVSHCPTPRFSRCAFSLSITRPPRFSMCGFSLSTTHHKKPVGEVLSPKITTPPKISRRGVIPKITTTSRFSRCDFSLSTTQTPKVQ